MEVLIVTVRDKKTARQIIKVLKNLDEVESIKLLTEEETEDLGLINAIEKGLQSKFTQIETLQKKMGG